MAKTVKRDDDLAKGLMESSLKVQICEPFAGLVIQDGPITVGAVVFNNYNGRDVHLSAVNFGALSISVIRHIAKCAFVNMNCHRVTAVTREDNHKAIKALEQIGFRSEGRLREHFHGADGMLFGLLRSEQKLIRL